MTAPGSGYAAAAAEHLAAAIDGTKGSDAVGTWWRNVGHQPERQLHALYGIGQALLALNETLTATSAAADSAPRRRDLRRRIGGAK